MRIWTYDGEKRQHGLISHVPIESADGNIYANQLQHFIDVSWKG
ncbi:hypothetical protein OKW29_001540 [Paraburkholderia sp. CI3]